MKIIDKSENVDKLAMVFALASQEDARTLTELATKTGYAGKHLMKVGWTEDELRQIFADFAKTLEAKTAQHESDLDIQELRHLQLAMYIGGSFMISGLAGVIEIMATLNAMKEDGK